MRLEYSIKPRLIALILGGTALYLAAQSLFGEYILTNVLHREADTVPNLLLDLFSVNAEETVPTWFSVAILLLAAVLLAVIALAKRAEKDPDARYWFGLAAIFLYLSIDEGAVIHEILADALHAAFNTSGYLTFAWQIVAVPLVMLVGLLYLRFVLRLPPRTRNLFILAGVLYVGGAVGVEAVSANQLSLDGDVSLPYLALGTVEELCEMWGVVVLIYALLYYIAQTDYTMVFRSAIPSQTAGNSGYGIETGRSGWLKRFALLAAGVIIINALVVYWAVTQEPAMPSLVTENIPIYQAITDQFPVEGLLVTHLNGLFNSDNPLARQFAASLLTQFDHVMVVIFMDADTSIFLAGDTLPFDHNTMAEFLQTEGETGFIIFDTPAVEALVRSA